VLADPKFKARLADLGATVLPDSPADFAKLIASETEKWGKVVKFARIKATEPENVTKAAPKRQRPKSPLKVACLAAALIQSARWGNADSGDRPDSSLSNLVGNSLFIFASSQEQLPQVRSRARMAK
jgi:hypothetical protein